jgi:hypothetical protein
MEASSRLALSIRQPFASLIAWGIKRFEGRNRRLVPAGGTFWVCSTSSSSNGSSKQNAASFSNGKLNSDCKFFKTLLEFDCRELTERLGKSLQDLTESDLLAFFPQGVVLARATVGAHKKGTEVSNCCYSFALQLTRIEPVSMLVHVKGQCGAFTLCGKTVDVLQSWLKIQGTE